MLQSHGAFINSVQGKRPRTDDGKLLPTEGGNAYQQPKQGKPDGKGKKDKGKEKGENSKGKTGGKTRAKARIKEKEKVKTRENSTKAWERILNVVKQANLEENAIGAGE